MRTQGRYENAELRLRLCREQQLARTRQRGHERRRGRLAATYSRLLRGSLLIAGLFLGAHLALFFYAFADAGWNQAWALMLSAEVVGNAVRCALVGSLMMFGAVFATGWRDEEAA